MKRSAPVTKPIGAVGDENTTEFEWICIEARDEIDRVLKEIGGAKLLSTGVAMDGLLDVRLVLERFAAPALPAPLSPSRAG
jgi:hypothetical protein